MQVVASATVSALESLIYCHCGFNNCPCIKVLYDGKENQNKLETAAKSTDLK